MPTVKKLQELKGQGYKVTDRELRLAFLKDKRANRPEPRKPDPLESLVKQVVEIAHRSDETMAVVLKTLTEMLTTLSGIKSPVVNIPENKGWKTIEMEVTKRGSKDVTHVVIRKV